MIEAVSFPRTLPIYELMVMSLMVKIARTTWQDGRGKIIQKLLLGREGYSCKSRLRKSAPVRN